MKAHTKFLPVIAAAAALAVLASVSLVGATESVRKHSGGYGDLSLGDVVLVQSYGQSGNSSLIPQSVALQNALRYASGGKGLGISLQGGSHPVYVVKVKKGSRIFRVHVDARNGRVLGQ